MITITVESPDPKQLIAFGQRVDRLLRRVTDEGLKHGETHMKRAVPVGPSGNLRRAVDRVGPTTVGEGHYFGMVGVHGAIAPHAIYVWKGTGIGGPFQHPIFAKRKYMVFVKKGEKRFRREVKYLPTSNTFPVHYPESTYEAMKQFYRLRLGIMTGQLAMHFMRREDL